MNDYSYDQQAEMKKKYLSSFYKKDYQARRHVEMKRRFAGLQLRRARLESELGRVKTTLLLLAKQIELHSNYKINSNFRT